MIGVGSYAAAELMMVYHEVQASGAVMSVLMPGQMPAICGAVAVPLSSHAVPQTARAGGIAQYPFVQPYWQGTRSTSQHV